MLKEDIPFHTNKKLELMNYVALRKILWQNRGYKET